jgi:xylulokinase
MLPHLSGTAFPEFNSNAKGVFFGINFEHTRAHFTRSIMESVAYMLKEFLNFAAVKGFTPDEIRALGGGSKSKLWNQIKADVTKRRIVTIKNTEAACLGSAILAGKGIGLYNSIKEAAQRFVETDKEYEPDINNSAAYMEGYEVYRQLYTSLKNIYNR